MNLHVRALSASARSAFSPSWPRSFSLAPPLRPLARALAQGLGLLLALNVAFALAIVAVNSTTDHGRLGRKLIELVKSGQITRENGLAGFDGHLADRYSECTALSLNLAGDPGRSALRMFADSDIVYYPNNGRVACQWLTDDYPKAEGLLVLGYLRYWHGYQIVTKPLMMRLELGKMRLLLGLVAILACLGFFHAASAQLPAWAATALFFSGFLLLTDLGNLNASFSHSISIAAAFASGALVTVVARGLDLRRIFLAALAGSAFVCYVDLAIVQLLSLMVALFGALAASVGRDGVDARFLACTVGVVAAGWAGGQIGSLLIRFGLSAAVQPDPLQYLVGLWNYIMYRFGGHVAGLTNTAMGSIKANVAFVTESSFLRLVNCTFAIVVAALLVRGYRFVQLKRSVWFLVPALIPFLWFAVLRNHSEAHAWMMYRAVSFSVLCLWAALLYGMMPTAEALSWRRSWTRWRMSLAWPWKPVTQ
jgi:hypothetical protein